MMIDDEANASKKICIGVIGRNAKRTFFLVFCGPLGEKYSATLQKGVPVPAPAKVRRCLWPNSWTNTLIWPISTTSKPTPTPPNIYIVGKLWIMAICWPYPFTLPKFLQALRILLTPWDWNEHTSWDCVLSRLKSRGSLNKDLFVLLTRIYWFWYN